MGDSVSGSVSPLNKEISDPAFERNAGEKKRQKRRPFRDAQQLDCYENPLATRR